MLRPSWTGGTPILEGKEDIPSTRLLPLWVLSKPRRTIRCRYILRQKIVFEEFFCLNSTRNST